MHHRCGLFFRKAFIAEALDEFQGVEVVVAVAGRGGGEGAGGEEVDEGGWLLLGKGKRVAW